MAASSLTDRVKGGVLRSRGISWSGKSGPKPTFRPCSDAALRLPETGHSHIVQHSRLVKVSCADIPAVRRGWPICAAITKVAGCKGGKWSFATPASTKPERSKNRHS